MATSRLGHKRSPAHGAPAVNPPVAKSSRAKPITNRILAMSSYVGRRPQYLFLDRGAVPYLLPRPPARGETILPWPWATKLPTDQE